MSKFGKRSQRVKNELHPVLIKILDKAILSPPWDFGLHEGHRSVEVQMEYYLAHKSTIDGKTRRGYHNYKPALAFDFHCSLKGNTWDNEKKEVDGDPAYLEEIARHIQDVAEDEFGISLTWGGDWNTFKDAPHLQLPYHYRKNAELNLLY